MKTKKYHYFALIIVVVVLVGCSSKTSEIEPIVGVENTVVVFIDTDDFYWAIPGNGIEKVEGNQIFIKTDVIFSRGKGEGNVKRISQTLRNFRHSQRGSFQATGSTTTEMIDGKEVVTKLHDCLTAISTKPITLNVVEVIEVIK